MGLWEPRQGKEEGRRGGRGAILMQMTEGKAKKGGFGAFQGDYKYLQQGNSATFYSVEVLA